MGLQLLGPQYHLIVKEKSTPDTFSPVRHALAKAKKVFRCCCSFSRCQVQRAGSLSLRACLLPVLHLKLDQQQQSGGAAAATSTGFRHFRTTLFLQSTHPSSSSPAPEINFCVNDIFNLQCHW